MSQYAATTTVSVEKSLAEIKRTLDRYGATQFGFAEDSGRSVRFALSLPDRDADEFWLTKRGHREPEAALKHWEQACRQRWRALSLCIKAKLEAVESGISEFEEEFMAHIVLPGGGTVGQLMKPQIEQAYLSGETPPGIAGLLPEPSRGR